MKSGSMPILFCLCADITKQACWACLIIKKRQPFQKDSDVFRLFHCACLVSRVTTWFSTASDKVFLNSFAPYACFGREKEVCDRLQRHPLIDPIFEHHPPPPPLFSQKMGEVGGGKVLSASLAGRNLHLVIL